MQRHLASCARWVNLMLTIITWCNESCALHSPVKILSTRTDRSEQARQSERTVWANSADSGQHSSLSEQSEQTRQSELTVWANSADADQTAPGSSLIRSYTVFDSMYIFKMQCYNVKPTCSITGQLSEFLEFLRMTLYRHAHACSSCHTSLMLSVFLKKSAMELH